MIAVKKARVPTRTRNAAKASRSAQAAKQARADVAIASLLGGVVSVQLVELIIDSWIHSLRLEMVANVAPLGVNNPGHLFLVVVLFAGVVVASRIYLSTKFVLVATMTGLGGALELLGTLLVIQERTAIPELQYQPFTVSSLPNALVVMGVALLYVGAFTLMTKLLTFPTGAREDGSRLLFSGLAVLTLGALVVTSSTPGIKVQVNPTPTPRAHGH